PLPLFALSIHSLATLEFSTLSLHDALPISVQWLGMGWFALRFPSGRTELQSFQWRRRERPCRQQQGRGGPGRWGQRGRGLARAGDRKSTRLNSSHEWISYAVFCLKKKKHTA